MFTPTDAVGHGISDLAADLRRKGARVLVAEPDDDRARPAAGARARSGRRRCDLPDPEFLCVSASPRRSGAAPMSISPRHLQKVTRTR